MAYLFFSHWEISANDTDYEFYEKFVETVAKLSLTNLQDLKKYTRDEKLQDVNLKSIMRKACTSISSLLYVCIFVWFGFYNALIPVQVTKNCQNWLHDCYFIGLQENCCDIFLPVLTDAGFCYTFNSKYIDKAFFR